jgi:hypothetical protein
MNWEGCGRKRSWSELIYTGIYLKQLREMRKPLGKLDSSLDLKPGHPERKDMDVVIYEEAG